MLVGIDVGGTTTDAVLVEGKGVVKTAYVPTDHDNLLKCLLGALDELIRDVDTSKIERVVLSTTLITNMIAEGKTDPVALVLIPGPGTNPRDYALGEAYILGRCHRLPGQRDRQNQGASDQRYCRSDLLQRLLQGSSGGQVQPEKSCSRAEGRRDHGQSPTGLKD